MKITERPDWPAALDRCHRFFTGQSYTGQEVEARIVFYLQLLQDRELLTSGKTIMDLGAGIYWFDPLAKFLGATPVLVDDYGGGGGVDNQNPDPARKLIHRYLEELKLEIKEQDILTEPLPADDASIDAVTCFHCLEHWHNSPKQLFKQIKRVLKPGGWLFLATPNAANIRKRISVLLGGNNWSPLGEWYDEEPVFRGHVREPIVSDLHQICHWNGLDLVATYGRNFIGRDSQVLHWLPRWARHNLAAGTQQILQFFPTLCSDIHVVARKPL
jgi:SAM-dependent methyltransferase